MMLKGLTTQHSIRQTHGSNPATPSCSMPRQAASALFSATMGQHLGATVIGTVGSDEKEILAKAHGCAHTIVYST